MRFNKRLFHSQRSSGKVAGKIVIKYGGKVCGSLKEAYALALKDRPVLQKLMRDFVSQLNTGVDRLSRTKFAQHLIKAEKTAQKGYDRAGQIYQKGKEKVFGKSSKQSSSVTSSSSSSSSHAANSNNAMKQSTRGSAINQTRVIGQATAANTASKAGTLVAQRTVANAARMQAPVVMT